ncbi:MAG: putative Rossmann fold flavoprotein [Lentimonas sp.]|jgi:predicted Rossmann fold flavoprotein
MIVSVIGGGAAGFFAAISAKKHNPNAVVTLYEKSDKILAKVKVSGGGRCNVTNGCSDVNELIKAYPRGGKKLKKAFFTFNTTDTVNWFESRKVPLTLQDDGCYFPVSQDSQTIIDCLISETIKLDIKVKTSFGIDEIAKNEQNWTLVCKRNDITFTSDKVIITTGGSPKLSGLDWLKNLGHKIEFPVPSLFTFNMPDEIVRELMGVVVEKAKVTIIDTKLKSDGPLLITHWGMSGPAILILSAFGARELSDKQYVFKIKVNWVDEIQEDKVRTQLESLEKEFALKKIVKIRPYQLPERLWNLILQKADINLERKWNEIGKKKINKLVNLLTQDEYKVRGKTTFKEEFVTCGGVSLKDIDMNTMQSKVCEGIYFAGEVMDVDAITGGYNFQAAWSTGFVAGKLN